jgi:hypothetical protein
MELTVAMIREAKRQLRESQDRMIAKNPRTWFCRWAIRARTTTEKANPATDATQDSGIR